MKNCMGYTRSLLAPDSFEGARPGARAGFHSRLRFGAARRGGPPLNQTRTRSIPPLLAAATYSGIQLLPRIWLAISTTM